jgi:hypothetical protein
LVLQQKLENFHARQTICNELEWMAHAILAIKSD